MNQALFVASELGALIAPVAGLSLSRLFPEEQTQSRLIIFSHLSALILAVGALAIYSFQLGRLPVCLGEGCFSLQMNAASTALIAGVTFISLVVIAFSERYLGGDTTKIPFVSNLSMLSSTAAFLAATDNLIVSFVLWHLLSLGLWQSMRLQKASKASARTVLQHHMLSDFLLLGAIIMMVSVHGKYSKFSGPGV